jgi:hypothetical protein
MKKIEIKIKKNNRKKPKWEQRQKEGRKER